MSAPTIPAPTPMSPAVAELLPRAVDLSTDLGRVPARNRLMSELKIGATRADAVRDALGAVNWETVRLAVTHAPEHADEFRRAALRIVCPDLQPPNPWSGPGDEQPPALTAGPGNGTPADSVLTPADPDPVDDAAQSATPMQTNPPVPDPVVNTQVTPVVDPVRSAVPVEPVRVGKPVRSWPVLILALPAFVAIWGGWVGLGGLTGFGPVNLLPGIVADGGWATINTAITLPIGVETYAAFALRAWLSPAAPARARRFARWSTITSLLLGALGQVAYHHMEAANVTHAPAWITTLVSCLPVAVLGMGAALAHLLHTNDEPAR